MRSLAVSTFGLGIHPRIDVYLATGWALTFPNGE